MMSQVNSYTVRIQQEEGEQPWAEVVVTEQRLLVTG
jgi:hypothetical protein